MNNIRSIHIALSILLLPIQATAGHKKNSFKAAHHEPEQHFNIDSLPLSTKLSLILQYTRELEIRLPHSKNTTQLSNRQLASNIRIFAQSILKDTPPCKQCIETRKQNKK